MARILIKSPFSPYTGYGNDGIGLALALRRAGQDVYLHPTHVDAPIPQDLANLLTKRLDPPFDLTIIHTDPGQMEATEAMRRGSTMVMGWTMWEFATVDNMVGSARRTLKKRFSSLDALVSYDSISEGALSPYLPKKSSSLILQGGFDPAPWVGLGDDRDWFDDKFIFAMVGQLHDRKNPFLAIQAFDELKQEHPEFAPAQLHLKTNLPGLHPLMERRYDGLRIHYAVWSTEVMRKFYSQVHCLLAPSRGEGKNVPALEMLTAAGTVIATNWGGHLNWLTPDIGYPLDYELKPEDDSPKMAGCLSARASLDHLKELMWHVFTNRAEAKEKGELAARTIPNMCSWDSVVDRLFLKLKEVPEVGEKVFDAYQRRD